MAKRWNHTARADFESAPVYACTQPRATVPAMVIDMEGPDPLRPPRAKPKPALDPPAPDSRSVRSDNARCTETTKAGTPCRMFQLLDDPDGLCNIHRAARTGRAISDAPSRPRPPPTDADVLQLKRGPGRRKTGSDPLRMSDSLLSRISAHPSQTPGGPRGRPPNAVDESVLDRLQQLVPVALERLEALIRNDDGTVKPETQMRAAEAILDRFAAKRVSHETKTPAGQRKLDEELAPIIQRLRATGTDASDGDPG